MCQTILCLLLLFLLLELPNLLCKSTVLVHNPFVSHQMNCNAICATTPQNDAIIFVFLCHSIYTIMFTVLPLESYNIFSANTCHNMKCGLILIIQLCQMLTSENSHMHREYNQAIENCSLTSIYIAFPGWEVLLCHGGLWETRVATAETKQGHQVTRYWWGCLKPCVPSNSCSHNNTKVLKSFLLIECRSFFGY